VEPGTGSSSYPLTRYWTSYRRTLLSSLCAMVMATGVVGADPRRVRYHRLVGKEDRWMQQSSALLEV
jgi:hypothetical protein